MINMALKMPKSYRCSLTSEIKKKKAQHTEGKNRFPDAVRLSPLPGSGAVPVSSYQRKLRELGRSRDSLRDRSQEDFDSRQVTLENEVKILDSCASFSSKALMKVQPEAGSSTTKNLLS